MSNHERVRAENTVVASWDALTVIGAMDRRYSYREFNDFVRRFNQEELLSAVARRSLSLPWSVDGGRGGRTYRATPPWALAAVAKAVLCPGNAHRRQSPSESDLVTACRMYSRVSDDLLQPGLNSGFAWRARTAYEQFPYQEEVTGQEMSRAMAFFDDYAGARDLEVVSKESMRELIGAPTTTAAAIVVTLAAGADRNGGVFDPSWLTHANFGPMLAVMPRDEILAVIDSVFACNMDEFRREAAASREKTPLPHLDRYAFNPLTSRPFVRLSDGRLIAPVHQLIARRLSPLELYYDGLKQWGTAFTRDLGYLLEDYLGRQFRTLRDAAVHPEIVYRDKKGEGKSIDWFLVFDDLVLLVESKVRRCPLAARAADASVQKEYSTTLGEAFKQLGRTLDKVRADAPEFAHIPADWPIVGMVATLDPWYIANSGVRAFLPTPELPTIVASVRDIEQLVALGQRRSVSEILTEIMRAGDERQTWELGTALKEFSEPTDRNPLIMQAWERLPFNVDKKV